MHLRRCRQDCGSGSYSYWKLVESVRTARGPRQRVVAYLGDLDEGGRLGMVEAAEGSGTTERSPMLFDDGTPAPRFIEIDTSSVKVQNVRGFGGPWLAMQLVAAIAAESAAVVAGRHQAAELPPKLVEVTEHQALACRCVCCGKTVRGEIPAAVRGSCTGPRLTAALGYLSARVHGSRRAVAELLQELLGVPLSLGSILARESELTEALDEAYAQVKQQLQQAPAKNVDETGWFLQGQQYWLWTAATPEAALFAVDRCRNWYALQRLLGDAQGRIFGTLCTDRLGVYDYLKPGRRALCWAHLKRDFQRFCDRGGEQKPLGEAGLALTHALCQDFECFREGLISRTQLQRRLRRPQAQMRALLEAGLGSGIRQVRGFCAHLRKWWRSLWSFAHVEDLEPTNNHAERMLRPAVMWRNTSFGCSSEQGCRFVERMLSVIQTCHLQGRSILAYLSDALHAHRHGLPTPKLI